MLGYSLLSGILFGLYFSLIGLGLNLIFGVMRVVNLAHGDFIMLGALAAGGMLAAYAIGPIEASAILFVVFIIAGIGLYYLLVPRLLKSSDPEMLSIILFFGLSQVIEAAVVAIAGPSERSIPAEALYPNPVSILGHMVPGAWIASAIISIIVVSLIFLYIYYTRIGLLTRAIMVDRTEARATGIDVNKVSALAFGIGSGVAAVAGCLAPFMLGSISPASGVNLTIQSFAIIIIGSLGSPWGTVLGGLIYGVSIMIMQSYLSSWTHMVPYMFVIIILLVRPNGLLGHRVRNV